MHNITFLPESVKSKLRSGVAITSVAQCVEELVLNSIDAEASCIAIRVDVSSYKIQVIDNGVGISKEQFTHLGERYATSKSSGLTASVAPNSYGYRGEALASIRDISNILIIESKCSASNKTFVKCFTQNLNKGVSESSTNRASCGTTVTALDFMYNLPVRRNNVNETFDLEYVKERIDAVAIIHPQISFTLRNDSNGSILIQTLKSESPILTFTSLYGSSKAKLMKKVNIEDGKVKISGYIGTEGHSSKKLQFIYINKHWLSKSKIHKLINNMCCKTMIGRNSKHGNFKSTNSQDFNNFQMRNTISRSFDRWCMVILNYECQRSEYDMCLEPRKSIVEFEDWDTILRITKKLFKEFFCKYDLIITSENFCQIEDRKNGKQPSPKKRTTIDNNESSKDFSDEKMSLDNRKYEVLINAKVANCSLWSLPAIRVCEISKDSNLKSNIGLESPFFPSKQNTFKNSSSSMGNSSTIIAERESPIIEKEVEPYPNLMSTLTENTKKFCDDIDLFPTKYPIVFRGGKRKSTIKTLASKAKQAKVLDKLKEFKFRPKPYKNLLKVTKSNSINNSNSFKEFFKSKDSSVHDFVGSSDGNVSIQNVKESCKEYSCNANRSPNSQKKSCWTKLINKSEIMPDVGNEKLIDETKHCEGMVLDDQGFNSTEHLSRDASKSEHSPTINSSVHSNNDLGARLVNKSKILSAIGTEKLIDEMECCEGIVQDDQGFNSIEHLSRDSFKSEPSPVTKLSTFHRSNENESNQNDQLTSFEVSEKLDGCKLDLTANEEPCSLQMAPISSCCKTQERMLCKNTSSTDDVNAVHVCSESVGNDAKPMEDIKSSALASGPEENTSGYSLDGSKNPWITDNDDLGNVIYINELTGNSSYILPHQCLLDDSKLDEGSDLFLTRLISDDLKSLGKVAKRPKLELQNCSSSYINAENDELIKWTVPSATSTETGSLLENWINPVFNSEKEVLNVEAKQRAGIVKVQNSLHPYKFKKEMLNSIKVLGQIDKKFILCLATSAVPKLPSQDNLLVLFDQHAVHERIRVEFLTKDAYLSDDESGMLKRAVLQDSFCIHLHEDHVRILQRYKAEFLKHGIDFQLIEEDEVRILSVPECLMKKEMNELKNNRSSVLTDLISNLLTEELQALQATLGSKTSIPKTVWEVICSQACRGAIKFGHTLTNKECEVLLKHLAECNLPFQCAHGRPSFIPLFDLQHLTYFRNNQVSLPNLDKLKN